MEKDDSQKIYELTFLANPSLPEEELLNLAGRVKEWIVKDADCEIIKESSSQKRKLGYSVNKFQSAFLVSLIIRGSSATPEVLEKKISAEEKIIRHLFINYSQKELAQLAQAPKAVRIKREAILHPAQSVMSSASTQEEALKEEKMDKESLKEIDKRLEEILGKTI